MKINGLKIESGNNGKTHVEIWSTCHSVEDVDDTIAWLNLAKHVMRGWEKINAKASRKAQAAACKDEATQPGKIQGEPLAASRSDGK